jgi:hypothetical protein
MDSLVNTLSQRNGIDYMAFENGCRLRRLQMCQSAVECGTGNQSLTQRTPFISGYAAACVSWIYSMGESHSKE